MKTAKEIFNGLGYKHHEFSDLKFNKKKNDVIEVIWEKQLGYGLYNIVITKEGYDKYFIFASDFEHNTISTQEHQAIHQQLEEMGWLDENS